MRIRAIAGWASVAMLCMFAGACNKSNIDPNLPAISSQPVDATAKAGSTATFTVVATGQAPLTYQWFVFAKAIKGATSASYTTGTLAISDNNSFYFCLVTNSIGSIESNEALLTVTATSANPGVTGNTLGNANPSDVLTQHNDAERTGQYLGETLLTPTNVNAAKFGKLGTLITDGQIDAQPLYASGVTLPSGDIRNILYAATEHGSVYAFDAATGSVIWQTGLAGANEQPVDSGACSTTPQERGITATPVIDRTRGAHGAIYVVANTKDSAGTFIQRIHALDLATGAELVNGPTLIQASAIAANNASSSASQNFDAASYQSLSGLQLVNGKVYAAWGSTCGTAADSGWVMGFDGANLNSAGAIYLAPAAGPQNPGFSVTGLSADSTGNLYVFGETSVASRVLNTPVEMVPSGTGNALLKLSTENGLSLSDHSSTAASSSAEMLSGSARESASVTVIPDFTDESGKTWRLAIGAGSDGDIYLLNRGSLGDTALRSSRIVQVVADPGSSMGVTSAVAYFGNTAFHALSGEPIKAFVVNNGQLSNWPAYESGNTLRDSGAQISISANGSNTAILWAMEDSTTGILHAYDAADLSRELYNSTQAANSRDAINSVVSATSPTIAGGRVYVVTKNGIVVFGQLK